eukprot:TRINITY_DN111248_c0_g1_i1.p2 TRINITY_DN111248_c0_g1~~TRINITY_DN111248_c0_g1_i1.p2  ORF type:complete len:111 (+),score=10.26 TRINITY_DN111248_c0_g1_i1:213-545(+)
MNKKDGLSKHKKEQQLFLLLLLFLYYKITAAVKQKQINQQVDISIQFNPIQFKNSSAINLMQIRSQIKKGAVFEFVGQIDCVFKQQQQQLQLFMILFWFVLQNVSEMQRY